MLLLSENVSWYTGRTINVDPENGHTIDFPEAQKLRGRVYKKGHSLIAYELMEYFR
jgi:hypothetical protein